MKMRFDMRSAASALAAFGIFCALALTPPETQAQETQSDAGAASSIQLNEAARADIRAAMWGCWADVLRLCPQVQRGGGRVLACLDDRRDDVSLSCRPHLNKARTIGIAFNDCSSDIDRFCSTEPPGNGRIVSCLSRHKSDLSKLCRSGIGRAWKVLGY